MSRYNGPAGTTTSEYNIICNHMLLLVKTNENRDKAGLDKSEAKKGGFMPFFFLGCVFVSCFRGNCLFDQLLEPFYAWAETGGCSIRLKQGKGLF